MLLANDTQVLEGPDIADVRGLLHVLPVGNKLRFNAQVLEGPAIADTGSLTQHPAGPTLHWQCSCVAQTTRAASTPAALSHDQRLLVLVLNFIV